MDEQARIDKFLDGSPFAVVGASQNRAKYGNKVLRAFLQTDRVAYPINPAADEIEGRLSEWRPPPPHYTRGYGRLFLDSVLQADKGCDFDFLHAGAAIPEPEIH